MDTITRGQRIYFTAVGLLALWVGVWGYFIPAYVDWAIPWVVPPLHARFLGAMYLSGAAFMVGCLLARRYAEVRVVVPMIAIWTGILFIVSLFHLSEFDYARGQTWIWFGAYLTYPLIALWLIWEHRALSEPISGPRLPGWVRGYLLGQGLVTASLAAALLFAPAVMVNLWPWKITPLLAQLYSAPFLSYGLGSLLLARQQTWAEIRIGVAATLVFAGGVLLASLIHWPLFSLSDLADGLWFGAFTAATLMLGLMTGLAMRSAIPN
jgi:hypothetical protein